MSVLITTYKGFEVCLADQAGGKAGRGKNITTTMQVFGPGGHLILKSFRFNVGDAASRRNAVAKAKLFIEGQTVIAEAR